MNFEIFIEALMLSMLLNLAIVYIFSHRKNDMQTHQKQNHWIHCQKVPRYGGFAFVISSLIIMLASGVKSYTFIFAFLVFLIGFIEDITHRIPAKIRLGYIGLISLVCIYVFKNNGKDIVINNIGLGFDIPHMLAIAFTVFAITGVTNAVNISDGINGLAAGISLNSLFFMLQLARLEGDIEKVQVILILAAGILGFFIINTTTGRIFMGDGGAYFTGFFLAVISSYMANNYKNLSPWFFVILLAYPITDTLFSIYRRAIRGKKIFSPDLMHLHTILYKRRFKNHITTTVHITVFGFIFSSIGFMLKENTYALILVYLIYVLIYITVYYLLIRTMSKEKN